MTVAQAVRLREHAEEWPRCGDQWPIDRAEKQAERVLVAALGPNYKKEMCLG